MWLKSIKFSGGDSMIWIQWGLLGVNCRVNGGEGVQWICTDKMNAWTSILPTFFIKSALSKTLIHLFFYIQEEIYDKDKGNYLVRFQSSPLMSTYSLCWIMSDFHVVEEDVTSSGVQVRGLAKNGQENALKYATVATKRSVEFFEQYLGVDYGLPKLGKFFII